MTHPGPEAPMTGPEEAINAAALPPPGADTPQSVAVEIYDQIYHLRGSDPDYIERLAALVDAKMRAVSAHGGTVDSLRVSVLAALNIADELLALRQRYDTLASSLQASQHTMRSRAGSIAVMLDEVLDAPRERRAS